MWEIGANPEPAAQPLDTAEVVSKLRLSADEATAQAAVLATAIAGARVACETFIGRPLISREVILWGESWWDCQGLWVSRRPDELSLPFPGVSAVASVTYLDSAGTVQTWSSATGWEAVLPTGDRPARARVRVRYGQSFPSSPRCQPGAVKVTYTTGFGVAFTNVPARIREGLLLYVGEAYARRELATSGTIIAENPVSAERCWSPYRTW